jgi:hypothetical protein
MQKLIEIIKKVCGNIPPERRIAVIVALFSIFAAINIFVVASAIYSIGRDNDNLKTHTNERAKEQ